jgi:hypothetical protein
VVGTTPHPNSAPGTDPVPTVQEAEWAPGPVWTGAENLAPTGIRSLDRPARSQSPHLPPSNAAFDSQSQGQDFSTGSPKYVTTVPTT